MRFIIFEMPALPSIELQKTRKLKFLYIFRIRLTLFLA